MAPDSHQSARPGTTLGGKRLWKPSKTPVAKNTAP